jgi:predicted ribosomally synthesized peptide with nif11-like leader
MVMSQEQAKAYIEKMKTDGVFRARALAVESAARTHFIIAEGFDCSAAEVDAAATELSDDELAKVAGGAFIVKRRSGRD